METHFPILDGKFIEKGKSVLLQGAISSISHFSLEYVLRASENNVFFFKEHMALIVREASFFRMPLPVHIQEQHAVFFRELQRLLNKNKLFGGAKILLTIWSENGKPHYFIQAFEVESPVYKLSDRGALFHVLELPVKSVHPASVLPSFSSQLWKVGEVFCRENGFDQCLIQSQFENIIEVPYGNLFVLKENKLITPDLKVGPVHMVLREKVMKAGENIGLEIVISEHLSRDMLLETEEIFWTDNVYGLQWGMGWKDRRFFCRYSRLLINELNRIAKKES